MAKIDPFRRLNHTGCRDSNRRKGFILICTLLVIYLLTLLLVGSVILSQIELLDFYTIGGR